MIHSQYSLLKCAFEYTNNPFEDLLGYIKGILFNMNFLLKGLFCARFYYYQYF